METPTTPTTTPRLPERQEKPWPKFPLYWHSRGYWMCKRGGEERRYTADANESYRRYLADEKADERGEAPARAQRRYLLKDAVNMYLTRQKRRMEAGEIGVVQFSKCRLELETMLPKAVRLGIALSSFRSTSPADTGPATIFHDINRRAMARGVHAAQRHIIIVRATLDHAAEKKLMQPPDYGDDFNPPTASVMDKKRNELDAKHGDRAWTVEELRTIIEGARMLGEDRYSTRGNLIRKNPHLYAQVLLALFAGFGSDDCSCVWERALIRDKGVIRFPRVKNGRPRVAALPKFVFDAIDRSIAARKPPARVLDKDRLFLTERGTRCNVNAYLEDDKGPYSVGRNDTIGQNFKRLVHKLGLDKYRAGFKTLRAMCRTLMVGAGVDPDIIKVVMGRKFAQPVDEYYLRGDMREKLVAVAEHIERQLFPKQTESRPAARQRGPASKAAPRRAAKPARGRKR